MTNENLEISVESLKKLPKFYANKKTKLHKTGLGSSAALVTSLVACVLCHLKVVDLSSEGKEFIHRLAQFCHCLSQGKVGSGFDVSSATFGSQKYTRFSPNLLKNILDKIIRLECNCELAKELNSTLVSKAWDHKHVKFSLPPDFHLVVGDVKGGSETPSMVSKVLKWRSSDPSGMFYLFNILIFKSFRIVEQVGF